MNWIEAFWSGLTAKQKRKGILALLVVAVLGVGVWGYRLSRGGSTSPPVEQKKEISLEPKMLEKSLVMESQKELRRQEESITQLRQELESLKKEKEEKKTGKDAAHPPKMTLSQRNAFPAPPPPPPIEVRIPPPPSPGREGAAGGPEREVLGEIAVISNPYAKAAREEEGADRKKEKRTIYLPPSFMEATLLTGLDAETVESAKGNPEPVLLRIRDLAVLPNQIKANLKGCFVIAHGFGKLSKERVELRLVTLSCLAKNGQAVIDQGIKGYVADEDGKNGLRGNVVSRMGSAVARGALAGFFGGAGDAFRASASATAVSPLGATQLIKPEDLGKAAIGGGLSGGSDQLEKLYLDLARQATPIIEVGATKTVTLVVTEGVDLVIKEICIGGQSCEK
ncbi:TraB/VirB10 family protein [Candidatus Manganitrophus noduliformans]|uniref:Conjugal transfer protein TraB n=1 Tax=Candidatus Manganitrophus noduliformans TaxID=2606439 RepID=A0A7X6IA64_9BACT|nr:TraB/VirB10 family protein [Candidatus Manganitrophus noduliformans]NKE70161.1 conjugal transfer protein TraB [Candidatus Manganitrophus noduliformans]